LDWAHGHFLEFKDGTLKEQWADPAKTAELYLEQAQGRTNGRKEVSDEEYFHVSGGFSSCAGCNAVNPRDL
jgi:hypothetical protein